MTIPWRVLLVSLAAQLSKAATTGVLTASCHSDVIELNVPYDKPVELSELHYRGCNRANAEFTQNETTYHVNVKLDIQNCTNLWRSAFQINHSGTLILGRYYAAIDKWINFDLWEFNTHCDFPKFYDIVFDYGTVAIERNDTATDPGSMELVFAASAYQTASYEDKVVHDLLRAGTMINIGLELVNEGLPGCEISFAPVSCQIHATVDDQAFNFTLYDYERDNCKNDVIDFSLNWDEGKEIWKLRHMLFLFGDVERTDMELHCRIAVCKNQDFVDNTCNNVASACMDNGNGDHFGNPCNQTYVTCSDGSTRANEPCPDVNHCDPNPCVNADQCTNRADTYDCGTCREGYEGKNCDIVNHCDPNPCVNADQCTKQTDTYDCGLCHQGYEGKDCDIVNHCDPNQCVNADKCTNQADTYDCGTCHQGYRGKNCDINNHCDPDPCIHADECYNQGASYICSATDGNQNDYGGTCNHGYAGKSCDIVDRCATNPCVHATTCHNKVGTYDCSSTDPAHNINGEGGTCDEGYTGKNCSTNICLWGYEGKNCDIVSFYDGWVAASYNGIKLVGKSQYEWDFHLNMAALPDPPAKCSSYVPSGAFRGDELLSILNLFSSSYTLNKVDYGSQCADHHAIIAIDSPSQYDGAWNPNAFSSKPDMNSEWGVCSYQSVNNTPLVIYACQ